MREIFYLKPKYDRVTQGSIITGCVAKGYGECEVFGLVITARCDLSHSKVTDVHYLPIVHFKDWLRHEVVDDIRHEWRAQVRSRLQQILRNRKLSPDFLDRKLSLADMTKLTEANFSKPKEVEDFLGDYIKWINGNDTPMSEILADKKGETALTEIMKRLVGHDISSAYVIEDWSQQKADAAAFRVVLLRDIKAITMDCALQLANGIMESETDGTFHLHNMLSKSEGRQLLYYIDAEVKSPFIEHIIQRFTNNFSRIGVEDLPKMETTAQLVEYSKELLK